MRLINGERASSQGRRAKARRLLTSGLARRLLESKFARLLLESKCDCWLLESSSSQLSTTMTWSMERRERSSDRVARKVSSGVR